MDDPYQVPESIAPVRDTFKSIWQRRLRCPHCNQSSITARQAWLRYPRRKIRCAECRQQSRVILDGAMWWKYWAVWLVPVVVLLLDALLFKWFEADGAFLNRLGQFDLWVASPPASWLLLGIFVLLVMFVAIVPIVVSFFWVAGINIRMIANHAILTPVAGTSCSHETTAE